ncbi:cysteine proteinase [Phellopilus nigrolimitatus]|nr:cysteine proteinase [Phellopilus nigrolimitatus]KAH8112027.1 cysteine proteinase [Phellopilus nigrolimitatus]
MPTLNVKIKHAGKVYDDLPLNTDAPPAFFRQAVSEKTSVPLDRMKIMVKGGVLKDDSDWNKVAPKDGQTFMVIGAPGDLPKPPSKPIVFLEDMDDSELAQALALPVGMNNLGNTCYMNATLQVMRAVPELQSALGTYTPSSSTGDGNSALTRALRDMYAGLRTTAGAFTPMGFLSALRQAVPQFGELARVGKSGTGGYAQQDAEECWTQIFNALKAVPGNEQDGIAARKKFIDQYMMGEMRREMRCDEAPEEEPTVSFESILKIECNIGKDTNFMHSGILDALNQKIEKTSSSLGRTAVYTQRSRLSRIPANLTVHMVRFAWKRDIGKKAKIMRKVKFPLEFDALDLCTDELKQKLLPVNARLKEIVRERAERRKVRKRTKSAGPSRTEPNTDVEMVDARAPTAGGPSSPVLIQAPVPAGAEPLTADAAAASSDKGKGKGVSGAALEPENVYRARELAELQALVPADVHEDVGASETGLYELVGIVTHKGAAADSGHYIGFVKKSALQPVKIDDEDLEGGTAALDEDDEDWYKFDDEKVSVFPKDKLDTLGGGGEDASAYVLLYRSKPIA